MERQSSIGKKNCDVSILIVSYNTRGMTGDCLRSLMAETTKVSYEVIVVDNASSDGSADYITREFPTIRLIASEENLGFARANNLASSYANGRYLLLLNPDTLVRNHAVEKLFQFSEEKSEFQIFGGRTIYADGSLNPTSCWRAPTIWNAFCRATGLSAAARNSGLWNADCYGGWERNTIREVDIVSGCFLLIRRDLWARIGGFDTSYFMYGEDWDLCLRARALGARCVFYPEAEIVHYGGASETVRSNKIINLFQTKVKLYYKHNNKAKAQLLVFLLQLWTIRCIIVAELSGLSGRTNGRSMAAEWWIVWKRRSAWASSPSGGE